MNTLIQSCYDILYKNLDYTDQDIYLLYDRESPLAERLSDAWIHVLENTPEQDFSSSSTGTGWLCRNDKIIIREFLSPPQPLYRGGLVNPENPHTKEQNRVITSHNVIENRTKWLDHDKKYEVIKEESAMSPLAESIKNELISLPKWSIVILVQSTNFRLSTFRIRLELFHRWVHVIEFNHLAYIPEHEFDTFEKSLTYRTDEYVRLEKAFRDRISHAENTRIQSVNGDILTFGPLEEIRWNTWDYSHVENKWGTFPIGEVFTEAINLSHVSWRCLVEAFPNEDFSVNHCTPFALEIDNGRVLPSHDFPPEFQKLYDWVVEYEGEVMVRELGFGLNPAITSTTPLRDINFHERKTGVHLSLGKKHGIYGKKLPKTEVQRFHIDVFVALEWVYIGDERVFENGEWI